MAKPKLPDWPVTPAMVPLSKTLAYGGFVPESLVVGMRGDADENFQKFAVENVADLKARKVGNATDLAAAYLNAFKAEHLVRKCSEKIEAEQLPADLRANYASVNIAVGVGMLHSAILVHMRRNWHQHAGLILCRSALELVVRAGLLAITADDEPSRWSEGPTLGSREERRLAELGAARCCDTILPLVQTAEPTASSPRQVYEWLCGYTHLDAPAIKHPLASEAVYAAIAYVGWLAAVVAETVIGREDIAEWPSAWPTPLPWL